MENQIKNTMICERCKKEISVEAKQCPYCKKWVYSKGNKKALKIIGAIFGSLFALLIILIVVVAVNTPKIDYNSLEQLSIDKVYTETQSNKANAIDLYENKNFKFIGKVLKIQEKYVIVSSETDNYSIDFWYDDASKEQIKTLKIGDTITFGGKFKNNILGKWEVYKGRLIEINK